MELPIFLDRLNYERDQVLTHWRSLNPARLLVRADSIIKNVKRGNAEALGQSVRKFHNYLGYQAWGEPEKGGECAGCLYRSGAFIQIDPELRQSNDDNFRPITIHLEHLVPVATLRPKLEEMVNGEASREEILRFVLRRSIAVGIHRNQKDGAGSMVKPGLNAHSHVFTRGHEHERLPFMRYQLTPGFAHTVFNAVTGKPIDFQSHTHDQATNDLIQLVKESGNDQGLLDWLS